MGLGLCLACVKDHMTAAAGYQARRQAHGATADAGPPPPVPHFAITMAPAPVPVPGPDGTIQGVGIVTLPSCYDHLAAMRPAAARSRLLAP
jgi:hypothetical protein